MLLKLKSIDVVNEQVVEEQDSLYAREYDEKGLERPPFHNRVDFVCDYQSEYTGPFIQAKSGYFCEMLPDGIVPAFDCGFEFYSLTVEDKRGFPIHIHAEDDEETSYGNQDGTFTIITKEGVYCMRDVKRLISRHKRLFKAWRRLWLDVKRLNS